jgi:predicted transcriptional regulator
LKPPCMVVAQYILPALRVEITKELVEGHGLRKTEAAEKMGVTPAAVTQYLNRSRGNVATEVISRSARVMERVSDISRDLVRGDVPVDTILMKMCMACHAVRAEGLMCELHKEEMPSLRHLESCACSLDLAGWGEDQSEQ